MENELDAKAKCNFCNRGAEAGISELMTSKISDLNICKDCATGVFYTFTRLEELQGEAVKMAEAAAEPKNDDGTCNCPNCTYNRLQKTDPILRAIIKSMSSFVAEEVRPDGVTLQ